ncbi:Uncharacterised protein [uncultured archaeon]|nr:Uncharacterised protein [uncultured archaeon]
MRGCMMARVGHPPLRIDPSFDSIAFAKSIIRIRFVDDDAINDLGIHHICDKIIDNKSAVVGGLPTSFRVKQCLVKDNLILNNLKHLCIKLDLFRELIIQFPCQRQFKRQGFFFFLLCPAVLFCHKRIEGIGKLDLNADFFCHLACYLRRDAVGIV